MFGAYPNQPAFTPDPFLRNQAQMPQTIQQIQQIQPQVMTYFANALQDMNNIQVNPNIIYVGINQQTKEIYTKQMNTDGITETNIYKISDGKQEQNIMNTIIDKLNNLEKRMGEMSNERYSTNVNANGNGSTDTTTPTNASI